MSPIGWSKKSRKALTAPICPPGRPSGLQELIASERTAAAHELHRSRSSFSLGFFQDFLSFLDFRAEAFDTLRCDLELLIGFCPVAFLDGFPTPESLDAIASVETGSIDNMPKPRTSWEVPAAARARARADNRMASSDFCASFESAALDHPLDLGTCPRDFEPPLEAWPLHSREARS